MTNVYFIILKIECINNIGDKTTIDCIKSVFNIGDKTTIDCIKSVF